MASTATRCCGGNNLLDRRFGNLRILSNQNARPRSLMIRNSHTSGRIGRKISAAMTTMEVNRPTPAVTRFGPEEVETGGEWNRSGSPDAVVYEKLDEWMRESVGEIVKNLREAPLMVHVYNEARSDDGVEARMVMEKAAEAEDWAVARGKWEAGVAPMPEGLIFVEELGNDPERHEEDQNDSVDGGATRAWGVVIQGKGVECPPACYLLKTSTAVSGSGWGLGFGCTHFCLVRVNSFRETADSQLRNCWLLQAQARAKARSQAQGL
ncbi:hypothetical protein PanWU01x14_340130 [Parasponia andersonii]|uniref:DUF7804 domain-containing protein n=1 Tax=Parasponia andersonii TaxID=3476 RepID=A0A2P5AEJ5_PARAD|nr:hypothetical protein PanWU01x14_340130 [Parasponia andersonii]